MRRRMFLVLALVVVLVAGSVRASALWAQSVRPQPRPTTTPRLTPTPAPQPTSTPRPVPPQPGGLRWSDPATWPSGRVPTRDNDVVIPSGRVIEVDIQEAEARTVTVEGTLRASRSVPSGLTLYGNLVIRQQGVLDYGRSNDRVPVPAVIRWALDESRYAGGHTMMPIATDVGLWATGDAQVYVHGSYRDAWSPLLATAPAGSSEIRVDSRWASGWRVGDEVVVGPTNLPIGEVLKGPSSPMNETGWYPKEVREDERRRIVAVLASGHFQLDAPLRYRHEVVDVSWTDAWGDTWTERLAGKVANLTSNIVFQAADPNHRPHIMFMDRAKYYVEDLAVANFGPIAKVFPMGRYAWHNHMQGDGSRGSYIRRARFYGGPGRAFVIHESAGVQAEDLVIYDHARDWRRPRGGAEVAIEDPLYLEQTTEVPITRGPNGEIIQQLYAANDCWIDRPLVMRYGHLGLISGGIWMAGAANCAILGAVVSGGLGWPGGRTAGFLWPEGQAARGEVPYVFRSESHSNVANGLVSWQNHVEQVPVQRTVDVLTWRNGGAGVAWGAYGTKFPFHQVRALGNKVAQLAEWAANARWIGFLADGMGVGEAGVEIRKYVAPDLVGYVAGVIRNVTTANVRHSNDERAGPSHPQLAHVTFDSTRGIRFNVNGENPPPGSTMAFRNQRGLPRPANFTLYHRDDPNRPAAAVWDAEYNAWRLDNDTTGTLPFPPRVRWSRPDDDSIATGTITLDVQTNASEVEFYQANRRLGRVPVVGGYATINFSMAGHPYRRAYFWALAIGRDGSVNASRVLRVNKF